MISERQRGDFFKISTQKGIQAARLWLGWLEVIFCFPEYFLRAGLIARLWIKCSYPNNWECVPILANSNVSSLIL